MWLTIGYIAIGVLIAISFSTYNEYIYGHFSCRRRQLESGYLGLAAGLVWPLFLAAISVALLVYGTALIGSIIAKWLNS